MHYEILKTGSKGNCIIVESKFMLDCGVPYKMVKSYLDEIKLIFISHSHSDHLNSATVKKIAFEHPNIVFLVGTGLYKTMRDLGLSAKQVIGLNTGAWYDIGMCKVRLDFLYHDVPTVALHLSYKDKKLFYATDTSKIDHIVAKDYDTYLIEANYLTDEEIDEKVVEAKNKGEFTYLERVRHTHLSQLDALNWLDKNKGEDSHYRFIHEHQGGDNNV